MFNLRNKLGLIALVCSLAGLAGCGGGSGTDSDKTPLLVCDDFEVILDNGQCGEAPPPPPCPEGQIRVGNGACFVPDFPPPTYEPAEDEVVIYFNKTDKNFAGYTLHLWQDCGNGWADGVPTTWPNGPGVASTEDNHDPIYGAYFIVKTNLTGTCGNFIIKSGTGGGDAQTNDLRVDIVREGGPYERMYFVIANETSLRNSRTSTSPICINDICEAYAPPALAISDVAAHWIDPTTILWGRDVTDVQLYASADASITANEDGSVANGTLIAELPLKDITEMQAELVPHLSSYNAFAIDLPVDEIKALLKQQLLIVGVDAEGQRHGTYIQKPLLLDALYTAGENDADEAPLGVTYDGSNIGVSVWAPTAQNVELRVFSGNPLALESTQPMTLDAMTGIWRYQGGADLDRKFYRFRVTGYNASTNNIEVLEVTDPNAISLSANGLHSQFVNFNDEDLKPAGWDAHIVPVVESPEAMTIYEMHVRDFSILDESTPAEHRGKYLAFTHTDTAPVQHLQALADAGLTHVHLLPVYDNSSINEDESEQINLDSYVFELCQAVRPRNSAIVCNGEEANTATLLSVFESYRGDEDSARSLATAMSGYDGFNWGYDPQHFNAPDGSYATDPQGVARITEMRAMNMALHNMGLRVVLDVVYPHTAAAGIATANSTFDKIVPGYYYRTNVVTGDPETGTGAGPDTATEHRMMAKFVADSVVQWAEQYKVDGFRFDQSGYMPRDTLLEAYAAVQVVDPDNYFYAEAWTPAGGTSGDRIAERATQEALAGTGVGTFNDRMRNPLRELALINGGNQDALRAGLVGNLRDFLLVARSGNTIAASSLGAYNLDPQEAVNYVEKHDDETLWDWMHYPEALPVNATLENRVRIHNLTLSMPILSQGVPFIHMGSDILRSKSMSRNSYNAGDWFNYVDFTKQTNNWAVGLPIEPRDTITDEHIRSVFNDGESTPDATHIQLASDVFNEFLTIASSSPLFSLTSAQDVMDRVGFHDGGTSQIDGLIVMSIDDGVGTVTGTDSTARADLDPLFDAIVVVFNGTADTISHDVITSTGFELHPIQMMSADAVVTSASFAEGEEGGTFTVPAYTTAIFVKAQAGAQGAGLSATATSGYEPPVPYGDTAIYVRGQITTPQWDRADELNQLVYEGDGIYAVTIDLLPGTYEFKVASADWSTVDRGVAPEAADISLDEPVTMQQGGSNITITLTTAGSYRFELNALDAAAPTMVVKDALDIYNGTSIYVRGTITDPGWDTANETNELVYMGAGIYQVTINVNAGDHQFKIASADWSTVDLTALEGETAVSFGEPRAVVRRSGLDTNMTMSLEAAGSYTFTLDTSDPDTPMFTVE